MMLMELCSCWHTIVTATGFQGCKKGHHTFHVKGQGDLFEPWKFWHNSSNIVGVGTSDGLLMKEYLFEMEYGYISND